MFAITVVVSAVLTIVLLSSFNRNLFTGKQKKEQLAVELGGNMNAPALHAIGNPGEVLHLTGDTFDKHVSRGKHFVQFYSPWSLSCYRMAPTWANLAMELKQVVGVTISEIDCTQYRGPCLTFGVRAYPLLLWIEDGKKIETYEGVPSLPDMLDFVKKFLGHDEL